MRQAATRDQILVTRRRLLQRYRGQSPATGAPRRPPRPLRASWADLLPLPLPLAPPPHAPSAQVLSEFAARNGRGIRRFSQAQRSRRCPLGARSGRGGEVRWGWGGTLQQEAGAAGLLCGLDSVGASQPPKGLWSFCFRYASFIQKAAGKAKRLARSAVNAREEMGPHTCVGLLCCTVNGRPAQHAGRQLHFNSMEAADEDHG